MCLWWLCVAVVFGILSFCLKLQFSESNASYLKRNIGWKKCNANGPAQLIAVNHGESCTVCFITSSFPNNHLRSIVHKRVYPGTDWIQTFYVYTVLSLVNTEKAVKILSHKRPSNQEHMMRIGDARDQDITRQNIDQVLQEYFIGIRVVLRLLRLWFEGTIWRKTIAIIYLHMNHFKWCANFL